MAEELNTEIQAQETEPKEIEAKVEEAKEMVENAPEVVAEIREEDVGRLLKNIWNKHQQEFLHFGKIFIMALIIVMFAAGLSRICRRMIKFTTQKIHSRDDAVGTILGNTINVLIWVLTVLIILDLFGINTASILTVLGAAGLAVGLAMKDSLSNIAAGLMLLFLRPYKIGDYVECGNVSGLIMEIGLFTTTLKTVDGIYISAPNSAIFGNPIKNYSRNPSRRADITVGIAYSNSLSEALEILKKLLMDDPRIMKEPAPNVIVAELADSSVNLTLRYWTKTEDYWDVYWDIKQQLKLVIENAGLSIPFPQRVITFANSPNEK